MRFFFYGTLLDRDVMALVLGRRLPPSAFVPAALPGHARRRAQGATYPIVVRDVRSEAPGMIVGGLSGRDVMRLAAYEGPGYRIAPLKVVSCGALKTVSVFVAAEPVANPLKPSEEPWDLVAWQRRHKRVFIGRLKHALSARPGYSRR